MTMTMSAITIMRLVPRVRVIVNEVALFPECVLQLGDVTSVTDRQTDTVHVKVLMMMIITDHRKQLKEAEKPVQSINAYY